MRTKTSWETCSGFSALWTSSLQSLTNCLMTCPPYRCKLLKCSGSESTTFSLFSELLFQHIYPVWWCKISILKCNREHNICSTLMHVPPACFCKRAWSFALWYLHLCLHLCGLDNIIMMHHKCWLLTLNSFFLIKAGHHYPGCAAVLGWNPVYHHELALPQSVRACFWI